MLTATTTLADQNISLVKEAYANFLNGNIPGIQDNCTDDVAWGSFDNPGIPYATSYKGKKGVGEFFAALAGSVDYTSFEPKEFFPSGDYVFVKGYHAATVKSTGNSFGHPFLMEFRVRNGKLCSFFAWIDTRDQADAFAE